jgi:arylsulfatase A-like enzyme
MLAGISAREPSLGPEDSRPDIRRASVIVLVLLEGDFMPRRKPDRVRESTAADTAGPRAAAGKSQRPNLVYVFADQLRHDVFGYAGDEKAITPHFDRLASGSVRFTNAVSVSPVCAAYRASLFTGKYTSSTGVVINEVCVNPNHDTIAYALHDAGYNLGYLGKWHLVDIHSRSIPQGPTRLGFQHASLWRAYNFNHSNYHGYYWEHREDPSVSAREARQSPSNGGDTCDAMVRVPIEGYQTDTWNRWACEFIEDAARRDEPFALFLSYSPPHDAWTPDNVPPENYEKFRDVEFPHPENWKDDPDQYADRMKSPEEWAEWTASLPDNRRCYYAMVSHLDDKLGELLDTLERAGCADNTIFVSTSDHGEMFGSHGRVQKLTFYEEAARVPFLVRWPERIPPGTVSDACLNTPDIAPTLLSLLGIPIPESMEGMDLAHCATGEPGPEPEFVFLQGMGHTYQWIDGAEWRAVRTKRYTYARYLVDRSEHLYDNHSDPRQMKNLAGDPAFESTLGELREAMRAKMEDLNDEFQPLSSYRRWMAEDDPYSVVASARGPFEGPYERVPSLRAEQERAR